MSSVRRTVAYIVVHENARLLMSTRSKWPSSPGLTGGWLLPCHCGSPPPASPYGRFAPIGSVTYMRSSPGPGSILFGGVETRTVSGVENAGRYLACGNSRNLVPVSTSFLSRKTDMNPPNTSRHDEGVP